MKWNPFRREERRNLNWPDDWPKLGTRSVSQEDAMRLGALFAAGRVLAGAISSLPLQQYRRRPDGSRQQLPLSSLFVQPSKIGTLHDWIFRAVTALVYRGNVVGVVTARDYDDNPTMVEWLHPDWVSVVDFNPSGPGSFTRPIWYIQGSPVPNPADLVHVPWFPVAGRVWGLSPMGAYAAAVSTGLGAQDYAADWFESGGVPPGTYRNEEQTVSEEDAKLVKQKLVQSIRRHEPIVHGKDWHYEPIAISPHEAQFVQTMRLTASQIAAVYGIPPTMIGGDSGTTGSITYANVEQESINFVQFTLLPWLTKLEDAFSALLPRGQYVKFNVDALIRTDAATRYANYERARLIGLNNIDELRALEDEPPLPNGQGQDYTPLQVKTIAGSSVPSSRELEDRAAGTGLPPALLAYWVHGAGAEKIRWGVPGDYNRCIVNIQSEATEDGHPIPDRQIHGLCATLHKLATGASPGHAPGEHHRDLRVIGNE